MARNCLQNSRLWVKFDDQSEDAKYFSSLIPTSTLCYKISDTTASIIYIFYEDGNLLEKLIVEDDETDSFESNLRSVDPETIENLLGFAEDFIQEQNICVSSCAFKLG